MPNLELVKKRDLSPFRKIAIGTWQDAYDPSVYGTMRVRMDKALRYIEDFRERTGKRITVTHLVAKATAAALCACPDANAIIRWNRIYLRKSIDLSILVLIAAEGTGKLDLSAVKVERVDEISLLELAERMEARVERVRAREDKALEGTRQSMRWVPFFLINAVMKLLSLLLYTLNLDLRWAGLPKDALGSALITNIGSLGLDLGYVPLVPYSRVPILVCPGVVRDEAVVEDGRLVPGKVMDLSATFDHRIVDGGHAAVLAKVFRKMFEDPYGSFDRLDAPAGAEAPAPAAKEGDGRAGGGSL
jgi:pyruvate dehydrogenase E2 component (dihydrolipoamide acetyltransferase)